MTICRLTKLFLATLCLSLASCDWIHDDYDDEQHNVRDNYINLTIAVSNNTANTRAGELPQGGENGDGREAGFAHENSVAGITLILYSDDAGINTSADPVLALVRYFPVTLESRDAQGKNYSDKTEEARYTTGDQPLGKPRIDFSKAYHAIVVANQDLRPALTEGTSKLSDVRKYVTGFIYMGSPMNGAADCSSFVMSTETDGILDFATATYAEDAAGDRHYDMTATPLVIERLAARIDFWAKNATGYDATTYSKKGYVYKVEGSATDKFVVTGIVPFNLANGDATYGQEYLLKRQAANTTDLDAKKVEYLADETPTSYVIDPKTFDKALTPTLQSPLSGLYSLIGDGNKVETKADNPYYQSVEDMRVSTAKFTLDGSDDLVVCYPMENTLLPTSPLYYNATGVAIIGYYYKDGTGAGVRYVYLSYLRHQGTAASYDVNPFTTPLSTTEVMGTTPMNYGVVRNNIYRVSINNVSKKGDLELSIAIKVKMWDPFMHDYIYI